jgi:hypothetical protein
VYDTVIGRSSACHGRWWLVDWGIEEVSWAHMYIGLKDRVWNSPSVDLLPSRWNSNIQIYRYTDIWSQYTVIGRSSACHGRWWLVDWGIEEVSWAHMYIGFKICSWRTEYGILHLSIYSHRDEIQIFKYTDIQIFEPTCTLASNICISVYLNIWISSRWE